MLTCAKLGGYVIDPRRACADNAQVSSHAKRRDKHTRVGRIDGGERVVAFTFERVNELSSDLRGSVLMSGTRVRQ